MATGEKLKMLVVSCNGLAFYALSGNNNNASSGKL